MSSGFSIEDHPECEQFSGSRRCWCLGQGDIDKSNRWRAAFGLGPLNGGEWTPDQRSRGLGDSVAKFTHATGIHRLVSGAAKALGASGCGCGKRQKALNELLPYS